MLLGFEHVGMTVSNMDRAVHFYCDLLGLTLALRKAAGQGEIGFFDTGSGMLEIFAANATIDRFRDAPPQEAGLRHITFAVESVDAMIEKLTAAGVEIVETPRNAHNTEMVRRVAFVRDPDGILVEFIERAAGR